MKVEFVPVWKQVTPDLAQELMAFWQASKAVVEPGAAATRALQAVCVARDGNGALCGVATAVVKALPRLRQPTYYYRQFFAKALRGQHQELAFFQFAKRVLQDYNAALPKAESLGILLEIENAKIAAAYRRAHEHYFAQREALGHVDEIDGISAGGMPTRVKCLHVLIGHALAAGPGVQPLGDEALEMIRDTWNRDRCFC